MAKKKESTGIINRDAVAGYVTTDIKTASGRKSVDCGDAVAIKMRGKTMDELKEIATKADLTERYKVWAKNLNPGQVRMALGNALRGIERQKNGGGKKKPAVKKAAAKKAAKPRKAKVKAEVAAPTA